MTPKEKAKELVSKFIPNVHPFIDHVALKQAKKCAIIAVNEMIMQNGELYLIGVSDEKLLNHYLITNSFLFDVKEEIEKL